MLIYIDLKEKSKTFLAANLDSKEISTITCYPNEFFKELSEGGSYRFFSFKEHGVVKANKKEIIIKDPHFKDNKKLDTYYYAGIANNTEELKDLLFNFVKKESFFDRLKKCFFK